PHRYQQRSREPETQKEEIDQPPAPPHRLKTKLGGGPGSWQRLATPPGSDEAPMHFDAFDGRY
ncbi:hypothetical protein, partial [Dactylosporangium aurantiacum]|uniref:hypothetical protein n=1 Tax=Dactylosporangium aurantiacum TaxID=35754 RepID=UPI001B801309